MKIKEKEQAADLEVMDSLTDFNSKDKSKYITIDHLLKFKISPKHYEHYITDETQLDISQRNRVVQEAIIDFFRNKDEFYTKYKVLNNTALPKGNKGKYHLIYTIKSNREFRDTTFAQMFPGKTILSEHEMSLIEKPCQTNYELINEQDGSVRNGSVGVSRYVTDEKTGMKLKVRIPFLPTSEKAPIPYFDITTSASPYGFKRNINQTVGLIAAQIEELEPRGNLAIYAIEKEAPYICQPYLLTEDTLNKFKAELRMLLDILHWSRKKAYYADYEEFSVLKELYELRECDTLDIHGTMDILDTFKEESTGFHII